MRTEEKIEKKLSYRFESLSALKNAFMPFVRDCGIFIPTNDVFHLSDMVKVTITLPEDKQTYTFSGEIIWITPKSIHSSHRHPGIGVQCSGDEGEACKKAVQTLLIDVKEDVAGTETI
jgi:type IV pilus assembly protein PilZ